MLRFYSHRLTYHHRKIDKILTLIQILVTFSYNLLQSNETRDFRLSAAPLLTIHVLELSVLLILLYTKYGMANQQLGLNCAENL